MWELKLTIERRKKSHFRFFDSILQLFLFFLFNVFIFQGFSSQFHVSKTSTFSSLLWFIKRVLWVDLKVDSKLILYDFFDIMWKDSDIIPRFMLPTENSAQCWSINTIISIIHTRNASTLPGQQTDSLLCMSLAILFVFNSRCNFFLLPSTSTMFSKKKREWVRDRDSHSENAIIDSNWWW